MRRLLHGLFAFAVLLGTWAQPWTAPGNQAETCGCCEVETACGCGMPPSPRTPRCPGGPAQAVPLVAQEARQTPQAESSARKEPAPWQGLGQFGKFPAHDRAQALQELPRPPDRLLQRLALLSTFRN